MTTKFDAHLMRNGVRGFTPLRLRPLDYRGHKCNYAICPHKKEESLVKPCSPGYSTRPGHEPVKIGSCGSWDCQYCGSGKVAAFEHKVNWMQRFHTTNEKVKNVMVTLTFYAECEQACNLHWRQCLGQGHMISAELRPELCRYLTYDSMIMV